LSRVVFYTKTGCPLCDEARLVLVSLAREEGVAFDEEDILEDPDLFARYRYRVPVLVVDDEEVAFGHFPPGTVRAALRRARRSAGPPAASRGGGPIR
jgi:glutaredoxin